MNIKDPYKPTNSDLGNQNRTYSKPSIISLISSLMLLLLGALSIYGAIIISVDDKEYEHTLARMDELANRIETQELTLKRESLIEYFKSNRNVVVEEHQLQSNSLAINFFVGLALFIIAVVQLIIFWLEFRR